MGKKKGRGAFPPAEAPVETTNDTSVEEDNRPETS